MTEATELRRRASYLRDDCECGQCVQCVTAALLIQAADLIDRLTAEREALREALELCAGQLAAIREANDADDPDSYRADDREGCLDWTFAAAEEAEKAARAALGRGDGGE